MKDKALLDYYLKKCPIQELFSVPVASLLELHRFQKGEFICRETEPLSCLYFIAQGRAKMYMTHKNGKVSLVYFYESGDILGELELVDAQTTAQTVQTMEETMCIVLPLSSCRDAVLSDAFFLRELCLRIGKKMLLNTGNLVAGQAYPLETQLADYILFTMQEDVFSEKLTEVSQYMGVSYRHLMRVLANFCREGTLEKSKKGYRILNPARLEKLSGEIKN